jgi:serine/threonine-protein kinase SRPK3
MQHHKHKIHIHKKKHQGESTTNHAYKTDTIPILFQKTSSPIASSVTVPFSSTPLSPIIKTLAAKKREESPSPSYGASDDFSSDQEDPEDYRKGGYHPVKIGDTLSKGRYKIINKLGWGHFSTVWLALDTTYNTKVALKIVKSASHYTEAARDEVTLCKQISAGDPRGEYNCVKLLDSFDHTGPHGRHVCMVFETMGDNLLTLIRMYDHRGVKIDVVRNLARQVLNGLHYLHTKCQIIHTDLKPENIMLKEAIKPRNDFNNKTNEEEGGGCLGKEKGAMRPAGGGHEGKLASALAAGIPLTKNQKKKLKKKLAKTSISGGGGGGEYHSNDDMQDSETTNVTTEVKGNEEEVGTKPKEDKDAAATTAKGEGTTPQKDYLITPRGKTKVDLKQLEKRLLTMDCKIVDFGNACWTHKHFTSDIQTRQYRSPEVGSQSSIKL